MPTEATPTGTDSPERHSHGSDGDDAAPVRRTVTTTAVGGITLVRIELRSEVDAALEVRVSNELDGPVLPPRREGVPAAGWDRDGFRGVVPREGRLGLGYACPTAPDDVASDDDAVSIEPLGPPDGDAGDSDPVSAAVRSLGRAGPPADAVPATAGDGRARGGTDAREENQRSDDANGGIGRKERRTETDDANGGTDHPPAVDRWLDRVETRLERAERLTDASADEAAATLEACGGIDAVADLPETVTADAEALRAVRARIDDLESRAAAADPTPVVSALSDAAAAEERESDPDAPNRPEGR